jgi:DNA-binding transcriptional regulator YiaG
MNSKEFKQIREDLEMSREQFAELLCLAGYDSIMNIEIGFRKPNKLAIRVLRYLDSIPKSKAKNFIEELKRHEPK